MNKYILSWPNLEVKMSFSNHLLITFTDLVEKERNLDRIYTALEKVDFEGLEEALKSLFASIPHDWFRKNGLSEYEGFYSSVIYSYMSALGVDVRAEDPTSGGRINMVVKFDGRCYLFEFKVVEKPSGEEEVPRKVHERVRQIYLIGVEFSKKERNVVSFEYERVK